MRNGSWWMVLEFFTIVMYGESRGKMSKKPCRQVLSCLALLAPLSLVQHPAHLCFVSLALNVQLLFLKGKVLVYFYFVSHMFFSIVSQVMLTATTMSDI